MSKSAERLHAIVHGRVQGVNFRYYTRQRASGLGLTGWVRNRPEGTVEVMAEGPRETLQALLAFLNEGPPAAVVDEVHSEWLPASSEFQQFEIRW